jgi:HrpA-like RNA helicase
VYNRKHFPGPVLPARPALCFAWITIDQIYYVIDPGFVKQNAYDPKLGMDSLVVTPSWKHFRLIGSLRVQSETLSRSCSSGTASSLLCLRSEIQRQNLSHTILMLKAMGINDLLHFDFMDPPPTNTMFHGEIGHLSSESSQKTLIIEC